MSRSLLFVPGDSERKLAKALDCGADALIIDLEDSVDAAERDNARQQVQEFLTQSASAELWPVRARQFSGIALHPRASVLLPFASGLS